MVKMNEENDEHYYLTKEGMKYIEEQTKPIYDDPKYAKFLKLTRKLIDKIFKEEK